MRLSEVSGFALIHQALFQEFNNLQDRAPNFSVSSDGFSLFS